jgi:hypothetical protein
MVLSASDPYGPPAGVGEAEWLEAIGRRREFIGKKALYIRAFLFDLIVFSSIILLKGY